MKMHPDDVLIFHEVAAAMRRVAKNYDLPLRSIEPVENPELATSMLGYCSATGDIRIALRGMVNGEWTEEPLSPEEIFKTGAHELAHLRHFNHGVAFQEFEEELTVAMHHQQEDHRAKVIDRLVKMQKSRESEAAIGNDQAAEAFATMINKMLIEYELNPNDIDYARAADHDPVIEMHVDLTKYHIEKKKTRVAWQESLARVVAKAHLCSFLLRTGSNEIWFVGTKSHALVADYAYGILVPAALKISMTEWRAYYAKCKADGNVKQAHGFHGAWLMAFVDRIAERFEQSRKAAVANAPLVDGVPQTSQALIRLDGAMVKVREYIDGKFKKKSRHVSALNGGWSNHSDGKAAGRAAADRIVISKGINGGSAPKQIGGK